MFRTDVFDVGFARENFRPRTFKSAGLCAGENQPSEISLKGTTEHNKPHAGDIGVTPDAGRKAVMNVSSERPVDKLLSRLQGVKEIGKRRWRARCPAHDDEHPSLDIRESDDGTLLLQCRSQNCSAESICKAVGFGLRDLFPSDTGKPPTQHRRSAAHRKSTRTYYAAPDDVITALLRTLELLAGKVTRYEYPGEFIILRFDFDDDRAKTFRPTHRSGDGWIIGDPPGKLPVYRLPELSGADRVYVVEGEKTVEAARTIGLCATTSAHGSKQAERSDWKPLARKTVVILPDNNAVGRTYANTVARILAGLSCRVKIVDLPDLPEGGDIADWIEAHDSRESDDLRRMIEAIADETPDWQPAEAADVPVALQWRPFPVERLPEPLRSFVIEGAKAIGCDPVMIVLPALAMCASYIGTTRRIRLKRAWAEPTMIWSAIVAESGTLKSPALDYAVQTLRELQAECFRDYDNALTRYDRDKLTYEADHATWKRKKDDRGDPPEKPELPVCQRYIVSDTTIEALAPILVTNPRGLLLARDELSGWLGGFNQYKSGRGSDVPNWLEMHRAGTVTVDRKTGVRLIYVPRAAVSVTGTIQPGTLRRVLTVEFFENGLAARLLLVAPPKRRKRWTEADVSNRTIENFASILEKLLTLQHNTDRNGNPVPVDVPLSNEGHRVWIQFYDEFAERQAAAHGDIAAAFSKLEGYAARFALNHQFIRWAAIPDFPGDAIDRASMEFGVELAHWFAHEAKRIYGLLAESDEDRDQRDLLEYIQSRDAAITVRDLRRGPRQYRSQEAAREALDGLVQAGLAVWEHPPGGKAGGRPVRRVRLVLPPGDSGDGDETTIDTIVSNGCVAVASVATPTEHGAPPQDQWRSGNTAGRLMCQRVGLLKREVSCVRPGSEQWRERSACLTSRRPCPENRPDGFKKTVCGWV